MGFTYTAATYLAATVTWLTPQSFTLVGRIKWAASGDITGTNQVLFSFIGAASGLESYIRWESGKSLLLSLTDTAGSSGRIVGNATGMTVSAATWYDYAIAYNATTRAVTLYWRATSAGSAGFSASTLVNDTDSDGGGVIDGPASGAVRFGNNAAGSLGVVGTEKDQAIFGGVLSDADLELFGKGAAPFQLTSQTLLCHPRDIGGAAWNGTPGQAATLSGTASVAAVADADGPLWDIESASQPSTISGNIFARFHIDSLIYTSGNRVVEAPDLSGGLAHVSQTTSANQPVREQINSQWVCSHCNYSSGSIVHYLRARSGADRSVSTGDHAAVMVCRGMYPNHDGVAGEGSFGQLFNLGVSGSESSQRWTPLSLTGAGAYNTGRFGLTIDANNTPTTQNPRILMPTSMTACFWSNSGNTTITRVGSKSATASVTTATRTRLMYQIGTSASGGMAAAFSWRELVVWSATKNSNADEIVGWASARHAVPAALDRALFALGTSTEAGFIATNLVQQGWLGRTPRAAKQMVIESVAQSGGFMASLHLGGVGSSLGLSPGDLLTCGDGKTARFLAQSGTEVMGFNMSATWTASGSTVNAVAYTGAPQTHTGSSPGCTDTSRISNIVAAMLTYSRVDLLINLCSSDINDSTGIGGASAALCAEANKNLFAAFRNVVKLTVGAGSALTSGENVTQATSGAKGLFLMEYPTNTVYLWMPRGTFDGTNTITGDTSTVSRTVSAVSYPFASIRRICRMHQPRTGSYGSVHAAYRALLLARKGTDFDVLLDSGSLPMSDDYTGSTDTGNTTYYNADATHWNSTGHGVFAGYADGVLSDPSTGVHAGALLAAGVMHLGSR